MGLRGKKPTMLGDRCKDCGEIFTPSNAVFQDGYVLGRCKECNRIFRRDQKRALPLEKKKADHHKWHLKTTFGITPEQYNELVALQLGGCAICKKPCSYRDNLSIDHDHESNQIRGLLCTNCNLIVGIVEKNEGLVIEAIEYLKRTTWSKVA